MILTIKKLDRNLEEVNDKAFEELGKDFNKLAKDMKSKFRIMFVDNNVLLGKEIIFGIGNSLGDCKIDYDRVNDYFSFIGGIDEGVFMEVRPILDKIKQRFVVEYL